MASISCPQIARAPQSPPDTLLLLQILLPSAVAEEFADQMARQDNMQFADLNEDFQPFQRQYTPTATSARIGTRATATRATRCRTRTTSKPQPSSAARLAQDAGAGEPEGQGQGHRHFAPARAHQLEHDPAEHGGQGPLDANGQGTPRIFHLLRVEQVSDVGLNMNANTQL